MGSRTGVMKKRSKCPAVGSKFPYPWLLILSDSFNIHGINSTVTTKQIRYLSGQKNIISPFSVFFSVGETVLSRASRCGINFSLRF